MIAMPRRRRRTVGADLHTHVLHLTSRLSYFTHGPGASIRHRVCVTGSGVANDASTPAVRAAARYLRRSVMWARRRRGVGGAPRRVVFRDELVVKMEPTASTPQ